MRNQFFYFLFAITLTAWVGYADYRGLGFFETVKRTVSGVTPRGPSYQHK